MKIGRKVTYENVLDVPAGESGKFKVEHVTHEAGREFPLATARTAIFGGHGGERVQYDHPTRWHRLLEGGSVWMSDYPIEQAQADAEVARIRNGRVLVGGLGLGYAATVLARRRAVSAVVVVERSPDVIRLVGPHVLRGDAARRKLEVVEADLFEYLRGRPERDFDAAYYDIWASDGEATFHDTVVPLLRLSARRVRGEPVCWNESVMRGQLFMGLRTRWEVARNPGCFPPGQFPTLEQLQESNGTVWKDWSVALFRWAARTGPDDRRFMEMAGFYAGNYGRRYFATQWRAVAGEDVVYHEEEGQGE